MRNTRQDRNNPWLVFTAILLVFVLFLQACAPAATETPEPAGPETGVETEAPPDGGEAAAGGILRVAMQPIVQTDPAFISSDLEVLVANHIYDYLVDINPDNEIIPRLAQEWSQSDDGLTYTFTLAEGITFHDNSPLTAEDVVWTFDRLRDPAAELPTSDLYANIESVEATGAAEVTFRLLQPNPFFLYDLSDNHALILKPGRRTPIPTSTAPVRSWSRITARKTGSRWSPTKITSWMASRSLTAWKSSFSATRRPRWMPCALARWTW